MITVLFDTHIYDLLAKDAEACAEIRSLSQAGRMVVVVSRTIREELYQSPFKGVPNLFPVKHEGNTVARVGIMRCGDRLGTGKVYDAHRGASNKSNDAFIADAAVGLLVDWLVSEDRRLRHRMNEQKTRCISMGYAEFLVMLSALHADREESTG